MVKLLKNEWKRYGKVIIALAIGTAAATVLDAICIMLYGTSDVMDIMTVMTVCLLTVLIVIVPVAAFIFPVISYAVDISRRGLLFLTPVPVWLAILTKVLFGAGAALALCLEANGFIAMLAVMLDVSDFAGAEMADVLEFTSFGFSFGKETVFTVLSTMATMTTTVIHSSLMIMAAISLARFAVNSTGGCVVLSIVFSYLINIIESMIAMLIAFMTENADFVLNIFTRFAGGTDDVMMLLVTVVMNIVYSGIFYAICTGLTSRKINLA